MAVCTSKPALFPVSEYIDTNLKKSIDTFLEGANHRPLPSSLVWSFPFQLCKEVAHYYSHSVLHYDLKPQNLLLDQPYYDDHGKLTFSSNLQVTKTNTNGPAAETKWNANNSYGSLKESLPLHVYVRHKRNNSYLVACRTKKSLPAEVVTYVLDCDLYERLSARYNARNLGVRVGENSNREALGSCSTL
ncbi:hypothetical protein KIW84_070755 [Lathyrus oleraceus]|uniref:Protein kinase domain-containing protein n=1 Tax=Pisum sativum TaxID=3888 RepID=A0A9D4VHN0_PEA|nr:hypothetical protein KIW84_070755 [Pisum sativum]